MAKDSFFTSRNIRAERVPANILHKARQTVERLEAGVPYWKLKGRRITRERCLISIPLGTNWRLIAIKKGEKLRILEVISHAAYNHRINKLEV